MAKAKKKTTEDEREDQTEGGEPEGEEEPQAEPEPEPQAEEPAEEEAQAEPEPDGDEEPPRKTRKEFRDERREDVISQLQQQIAELRGALTQRAPAAAAPPQARQQDEADDELDELQEQARLIALRYQAEDVTDAERERLKRRYQRLEEKAIEIRTKRHAKPAGPAFDPDQVAVMTLQAQFPEVFADDGLREEAKAEVQRIYQSGRAGKMNHLQVSALAAKTVLERRQRRAPQPSAATASKMAAASPRTAAPSGKRNGFVPTRSEQRMAQASFPDLEPADAVKKWLEGVKKSKDWLKANAHRL